ncbi:hypothetical protein BXZ70DRAFT_182497 [Cristinia sonorae]|uniref:Uncharacterized protein n=1 Tax=Cristinia sonorae TaxID=1940300 RepID=A0A8K0UP09_9AGAR|nr:hypothetical protein BXZ70DRAFT_182497 [Cristinia sonorae]
MGSVKTIDVMIDDVTPLDRVMQLLQTCSNLKVFTIRLSLQQYVYDYSERLEVVDLSCCLTLKSLTVRLIGAEWAASETSEEIQGMVSALVSILRTTPPSLRTLTIELSTPHLQDEQQRSWILHQLPSTLQHFTGLESFTFVVISCTDDAWDGEENIHVRGGAQVEGTDYTCVSGEGVIAVIQEELKNLFDNAPIRVEAGTVEFY